MVVGPDPLVDGQRSRLRHRDRHDLARRTAPRRPRRAPRAGATRSANASSSSRVSPPLLGDAARPRCPAARGRGSACDAVRTGRRHVAERELPAAPTDSPIGTRLMLSTPAGDHDVVRARHHALRGEVQRLLRRPALPVDGGAGHGVGEARRRAATLRPRLNACSPTCETHPMITSSSSAGSRSARATSAATTWAARSTGCVAPATPMRRPIGVRSASTTTADGHHAAQRTPGRSATVPVPGSNLAPDARGRRRRPGAAQHPAPARLGARGARRRRHLPRATTGCATRPPARAPTRCATPRTSCRPSSSSACTTSTRSSRRSSTTGGSCRSGTSTTAPSTSCCRWSRWCGSTGRGRPATCSGATRCCSCSAFALVGFFAVSAHAAAAHARALRLRRHRRRASSTSARRCASRSTPAGNRARPPSRSSATCSRPCRACTSGGRRGSALALWPLVRRPWAQGPARALPGHDPVLHRGHREPLDARRGRRLGRARPRLRGAHARLRLGGLPPVPHQGESELSAHREAVLR